MTRSDEPLFEPRIADWLEDDPNAAPGQALDIVLAAFPSIRQRRASRVPWRFPNVNGMTRLALAAAAVVAVAVGGLYVFNRGPSGPGGPPTPTPSPAPSPSSSAGTDLLDVSTWTAFTSSRYGFSAKYPATFVAAPSKEAWRMPNAGGGMFDGFRSTGAVTWLNGVSMLLPAGVTRDDWYDEYRRDMVEDDVPWEPETCFTPREDWISTTVDGNAADLRVSCAAMEAFVFVAGRVYAFGAYGYDGIVPPTTEPGVSDELRDLFELWLTTITIDPASAVDSPSPAPTVAPSPTQPPVSFTSPLYGYTVSWPAGDGWNVTPATVPWPQGSDPKADYFAGPAGAYQDFDDVYVAAQPVPEGMTPEAWLLGYAQHVAASGRDCKGSVDAWTDAVVGSQAIRRLDLVCQEIRLSDVAFVVDGTGYVMTGNRDVIAHFLETFQPGA
jgi:hypothetical protein